MASLLPYFLTYFRRFTHRQFWLTFLVPKSLWGFTSAPLLTYFYTPLCRFTTAPLLPYFWTLVANVASTICNWEITSWWRWDIKLSTFLLSPHCSTASAICIFSTPCLCLRGKLSHHFSLIHFRGIILKLFLCQNLTFVTIPSLFWHQIDRQEMIFYFYFRWGEGCVIYHFSFKNYNNHAGLSLMNVSVKNLEMYHIGQNTNQ